MDWRSRPFLLIPICLLIELRCRRGDFLVVLLLLAQAIRETKQRPAIVRYSLQIIPIGKGKDERHVNVITIL